MARHVTDVLKSATANLWCGNNSRSSIAHLINISSIMSGAASNLIA